MRLPVRFFFFLFLFLFNFIPPKRLAPQDYHRFHSPVDGIVEKVKEIPGTYYTVNPMAIREKDVDVFTENKRTVMALQTKEFGPVRMPEKKKKAK